MTTPTPEVAAPSLINTPPVGAAAAPEFVPLTVDALVMPEGFTLDPEASTTLLDIINNQALSPAERANALVNLHATLSTKSSEAGSQAWNEQQQAWQAEIAADPVIGGANLQSTIAGIGNLLTRFGNDDIRAAFDATGAGNNPHIVRFLATLHAQLKEPAPLNPGNPAGGAARSLEERMYGATPT